MAALRRRAAILGIAGTLAAAYCGWLRPRLLTWGATAQEVAEDYPGDELISPADDGATMATTLPVTPDVLWPWLVQMGGDRGGWYSFDWLDNGGRSSARGLEPAWQVIDLGQRLARASAPNQDPGSFTVVALEWNRTLVLRSSYSLSTGRDLDPHHLPAHEPWVDGVWGFHLRAAPGGATRLVVRSRNRGGPHLLTRPFAVLVAEPMHFVMQLRQFHGLRRRVTTIP